MPEIKIDFAKASIFDDPFKPYFIYGVDKDHVFILKKDLKKEDAEKIAKKINNLLK